MQPSATTVSTQHASPPRLKSRLIPPNIKQKLTEASLDGGKIRLRSDEKGTLRVLSGEYKTRRLQGRYNLREIL